tara:strand:+ start:1147 stop:1698 length:552 start_codon:yes stop_codon:yes gene_type:complete
MEKDALNRLKNIDDQFKKKREECKKVFGSKFNSIFKNPKNIAIEISKKKYNVLEFYENDKLLFSVKGRFHGIIKTSGDFDVFYWNNIIPGVDKRYVDTVLKMKNKYKDLFSDSNDKRSIFYHQLLNSEQMLIDTKVGFDKVALVKLLLYISGDYYCITPLVGDNFQIFTLSKTDGNYFVDKHF